jgi:hypothetical protein
MAGGIGTPARFVTSSSCWAHQVHSNLGLFLRSQSTASSTNFFFSSGVIFFGRGTPVKFEKASTVGSSTSNLECSSEASQQHLPQASSGWLSLPLEEALGHQQGLLLLQLLGSSRLLRFGLFFRSQSTASSTNFFFSSGVIFLRHRYVCQLR